MKRLVLLGNPMHFNGVDGVGHGIISTVPLSARGL